MAAKVQVYEEGLTIPTYLVGPPAKNPTILIEGHNNIYPYTLMDDINKGKEDKTYRSLTLENEYLKVSVLPELGGHIWSAYDKVAKKEMFYKNDAIKPGLILLRGSWCAYGLEFNFPCGHTVTTMSEIDSYMRKNEDGSGSIFVSDVEMVSRMKWLVEIRLYPGEANFRTNIRLMNGTEVARRYYFWANAGVSATDELQFVTPATETAHGNQTQPFPIQQGEDKSWYKNHHHAVDCFTINSREDYFGYYDHGKEFGIAHVAPWYQVRGKKFFTWGTGDDGLVWAECLTDNQGPYIEIQAGPFPTQSDFGMLQPHTTNAWESMWYPVRGIGRFDFANELAALRLSTKQVKGKKGKQVEFAINSNKNLRNVTLRIQVYNPDGLQTVFTKKTNLLVKDTFKKTFTADIGNKDLEVKVINSKGVHLLTYVHKQIKPKPIAEPDKGVPLQGVYGDSLEETFQSGYQFERYNNVTKALEKYKEAIEKDPMFSLPLVEMGKIHIYQGHYESAADMLKTALERNPGYSDAQYYYGVALKRLGRYDEAMAEFQKLSLDNRVAALGYYKLGQIEMIRGKYIDASHLFESALKYNPDDIATELMVPVSWRLRGRKKGPMKLLKRIREKDPTNFMALNEIYLLSKKTKGLDAKPAWKEMRKVLRDNPISYVELAVQYGKIGLLKDCIDILRRYIKDVKTPDVMLWYYMGYYLRQIGKTAEGNTFYKEASRMKQEYLFPHRLADYVVLGDAILTNREDDVALYALGNILASRRRVDEAVQRWKKCEKLKSTNSAVYRNLGLVLHRAKGKPMQAVKYYRKAIKLDPDDRELYWELDQVYAKLGMDKERVKLHKSRPNDLQLDMKTNVRLADAYLNLGKWDECLEMMQIQDYWPWEGGLTYRHLYVLGNLYKAEDLMNEGKLEEALEYVERSEKYPENIKIRQGKFPKKAPYLYYKGLVLEKMGKKKEARALWKQAIKEKYSIWILSHTDYAIFKIRILRKLGMRAKIGKLIELVLNDVKRHQGEESARYYELKGLGEMEMGQLGDAYKSLSKSLELMRSNITVKKALQKIQEYMKR